MLHSYELGIIFFLLQELKGNSIQKAVDTNFPIRLMWAVLCVLGTFVYVAWLMRRIISRVSCNIRVCRVIFACVM